MIYLIVGVEVSCTYIGKEFHILAYDFDIDSVALNELINWNKDTRINYNKRLIEYVHTTGLINSIDDYDSYTYDKRLGGWKALHYLMDKGIVKDFWDVLKFQEQCEEVLEFKSPKVVVDVIKNAGGYAVLAHPSCYYKGEKLAVDIMDQFRIFGIDGVECYSPYLREVNDASYYKDYCFTHGLGITAGSDCHGSFSNRTLGQPKASIKDVDLEFMNIK